jgi:superfamily I DNA/RNA helicase
MPIPDAAKAAAQVIQDAAAHSNTAQTRLIAGPGTGKSNTIVNRLCWLLDEGVEPSRIFVVSFTRASANDLKERIISACEQGGHAAAVTHIQVSTLHSLALRALRAGGLLARFPTQYPLVLDEWSSKIFSTPSLELPAGLGREHDREKFVGTTKRYGAQAALIPRTIFRQTQRSPLTRRIPLWRFTLRGHKRTHASCPAKSYGSALRK